MNARTVMALSGLVALSAFGQGTFQNLDFENAVIIPITGNTVQFAPAFPSWTGTLGSTSATQAFHNSLSLNGISDFVLLSTSPGSTAPPPFAGQFGIMLQSSTLGAGLDAVLAQTALIPADARS